MRLIDADELIHFYFDDENGNPTLDFIPWEFIENAPTIDAEPRKHGHWIVLHGVLADDGIYGDMGKCSNCGLHLRDWEWDYCPNCGSVMDEVDNG